MTTLWNGIPLGVQSWCFRKFGNGEIPGLLKDCGLAALEICQAHLDIQDARVHPMRIVEQYRELGITLTSYGIHSLPNEADAIRPLFEFAVQAGIPTLGVKPHPDSIGLVEALCREYGIEVAVHNHGKKDELYGKPEQLEAVLNQTSDSIGVCLDTGWLLDAGGDPVEFARRWAGRIYGVHFKDFHYREDGTREEALLGEGLLDVNGLVKALRESDFNGYATIEYEGEPENPLPSIKRCVERLRAACYE